MKHCPICNSDELVSNSICECGYHFEEKEIVDVEKIWGLLSKYSANKQWPAEVKLKKRITEIHIKKYGDALKVGRHGWSLKKTAKFLKQSTGLISNDVELAYALDQYPELYNCRNKTEAKKRLNIIKNSSTADGHIPNFEFEDQLQEYLETNWATTLFGKEWSLKKTGVLKQGKYNTAEVGEIDLLARHLTENRWLVLELKKDQSSDETVGQILRYMGWVKKNLAGENCKVEGIIISNSADDYIRYALECVPDLSLKIYTIDNGKLVLEDPDRAYLRSSVAKLSPSEKSKL